MTPEVRQLLETLEAFRAAVLKKLAGLSEQDARRSTVDSGTNVAGLVQHLAFAESKWFGTPERGPRHMTVDPAVSLRTLRAEYRTSCDASDEVVRALADGDATIGEHTLRTALLTMIGETARHAGHADIIREQIDGLTGR
jgi:hypothetical protein